MPPATRQHPANRPRYARAALAAGVLALLLSGCTSTVAGESTPDLPPSATAAEQLPGETLSGRGVAAPAPGMGGGMAEVPVNVPTGANSVTIDFGCAGGGMFFLEFGDSMMLGQAPLTGTCDGMRQLTLPLTKRSGSSLHITVPENTRWVAQTKFSTESSPNDAALAEECETYAPIYSALFNADIGYTHYTAFDSAEWTKRVDGASAELEQAGQDSGSILADVFDDLHAIVSDPARSIGSALEGSDDATTLISRVCDTNQSPVVVMAEFGG